MAVWRGVGRNYSKNANALSATSSTSGGRGCCLTPTGISRGLPRSCEQDSGEHQMTAEQRYPRRLIEVDLPIKRISAHARREKSIRHGHISTLHIWWARRPLAACRAVICASLWPDPADPLCPQSFRQAAAQQIQGFVEKVMNDKALAESCDPLSFGRWNA